MGLSDLVLVYQQYSINKRNLLFDTPNNGFHYVKPPMRFATEVAIVYSLFFIVLVHFIATFAQGVLYSHLALTWDPISIFDWDFYVLTASTTIILNLLLTYLKDQLCGLNHTISVEFNKMECTMDIVLATRNTINQEVVEFLRDKDFWFNALNTTNNVSDIFEGESLSLQMYTMNEILMIYCNLITNREMYYCNEHPETYKFIKDMLELHIASNLVLCDRRHVKKLLNSSITEIVDIDGIKQKMKEIGEVYKS